ncbi:hypothetical protein FSP39_013390 [Pinctada imbricata]|uniref:Carboxylic ester hydrolase n=1 Tax=Pinctada imbricata TaxID=66713 RepID=A0AA88YEC2_PINIB|nr:hypothetical protein FSP39_013390 [Pinctada imbricata]
MSENCLYLNIFAPRFTRTWNRKKVMVHIHGGYFASYSGSGTVFDGEEMARNGDVIVININYRLGAFGFLYTGDDEDDITGNYGYRDIIQSLQWIRRNIRYFGGSGRDITLLGDSAGAMAILALKSSDETKNLFKRGILQSVPLGIQFQTKERASVLGEAFVQSLGCQVNDTNCVKNKEADEIVAAMDAATSDVFTSLQQQTFIESFMRWTPIIDNELIPENLLSAANSSLIQSGTYLMGTTTQELLPHIYNNIPTPVDTNTMYAILGLWLGQTFSSELIPKYIDDLTKSDFRTELGYMLTDYMFTCPTRYLARSLMDSNKVWMYVFDQIKPIYYESSSTDPYCGNVVCHTAEIGFVFNSFYATGTPLTLEEDFLRRKISRYWTAFINEGTPNGRSCGTECNQVWPQYTNSLKSLELKAEEHDLISDFRGDLCDIWDRFGYTY